MTAIGGRKMEENKYHWLLNKNKIVNSDCTNLKLLLKVPKKQLNNNPDSNFDNIMPYYFIILYINNK